MTSTLLPPTRAFAIIGSIGLAGIGAWLGALVVAWRARRRGEAAWACALPALALVAGALGRLEPAWHVVLTGLVAGIALRNAALVHGAARWLTLAGLAAWIGAIALALMTFG